VNGLADHFRKEWPWGRKTDVTKPNGLVLSSKNKFIYFKNTKTAGTSIYRRVLPKTIDDLMGSSLKGSKEKYTNWLEELTDEKLNEYFKFTFVRNPWDRMVSIYSYFKNLQTFLDSNPGFPRNCDFYMFIKNKLYNFDDVIEKHSNQQYWHTHFNGEQFIDFVGRFESIEEDWAFVANKINVSKKLPHSNSSKHDNYQTYYNDETIELVAKKYKKDIEYFGYEFGM